MLAAARSRFHAEIEDGTVALLDLDLRGRYPSVEASLTLSVLTLQFTPIEHRPRIVRDVYRHTVDGGAFVLVEKVLGGSGRVVPRFREWEYVPEGWARERTDPAIKGWDEEAVVEAYRAKLPAYAEAIAGQGPIGLPTSAAFRDPVPNVKDQNIVLGFAYAVTLASRRLDAVSILDWGGGAGLFSLLARALLPGEVGIDYHCKDLPAICAYGRDVLPDARFHDDDSCLDRRYDLVVASSSLQYSEQWHDVLARLAGAVEGYLYLARVPVVLQSPSFVVLQRAYRYGFGTEFLSWVFNRDELLAAASDSGLELVRELVFGERSDVRGAPEPDETRGFLFRLSTRDA